MVELDGRDRDDGAEPPDEVVLPIDDHLDLHAFRPADVKSVIESYLDEAAAAGFGEVRLIHGRGIGAQREIVRAVLRRHPAVERFHDAPPSRGGWGATVVRLVDRARPAAENGGGGAAE